MKRQVITYGLILLAIVLLAVGAFGGRKADTRAIRQAVDAQVGEVTKGSTRCSKRRIRPSGRPSSDMSA
jgi:hypothetical protein